MSFHYTVNVLCVCQCTRHSTIRCVCYAGASLKITQMLKHFEHLASPMAQLVEICVNHYGVRTIVGDVMR